MEHVLLSYFPINLPDNFKYTYSHAECLLVKTVHGQSFQPDKNDQDILLQDIERYAREKVPN